MKRVGDLINIKSLDDLLNEDIISESKKTRDNMTYIVESPIRWLVDPDNDDKFLGTTNQQITAIDVHDPNVPYQINNLFWIPLFMVKEEDAVVIPDDTTSTDTSHVKYGPIFRKMIQIDHRVNGDDSNLIFDMNVNKISNFNQEQLRIVANLFQSYDPAFCSGNIESHTSDELTSLIISYICSR